jgi:uncharacterized protein YggE
MEQEIKKFDLSNRLYFLILATALVIVVFLVAATFWVNSYQNTKTIVISGDGKAYVNPDVAIIVMGVKTEAPKSNDAVDQNNTKMNAVISAVKKLGIDAKDIQTTTYNLSPVYNYTNTKGSVLTGYSLDQQITVKVRSFDKISNVLDAGTSNGANNIGNLQITVDNPEAAKAEARANAIKAAKQKASEMAKASGLSLGKVIDVSENNYYAPMATSFNALEMKSGAGVVAPLPSIQAGQNEFTMTVSLTYQVN